MKLNLSVDEVLSTTRTVRMRLDLTKPVPRSIIEECLELALQAPNGANRNLWRWVLVDDPTLIAKLAGEYRASQEVFVKNIPVIKGVPATPEHEKMMASARAFSEVLDQVPAMLVPLMRGRPEGKSQHEQADMWGSILQAVWSFFLALRERGLGSAWTSVSTLRDKEIAEILGFPGQKYAHVGLFPIAYTKGTDFKKAWRKPVSDVLTYNGFA